MAKLTLTWRTLHDDSVCPICKSLDGYQWVFETGTGQGLPTELTANGMVVWDIATGSEAHGHHRTKQVGFARYTLDPFSSCRCSIDHQLDLSDFVLKAKALLAEVEATTK